MYAISPRTAEGTLLDGTLSLDGGTVPVTQVRIRNSGATLVINDNATLSLATYFSAGGAGNDLIIHFQTLEGLASFTVASALNSSGGNFVNLDVPVANQPLFNALAGGERFILSATRFIATVGVEIGNLSQVTQPSPLRPA